MQITVKGRQRDFEQGASALDVLRELDPDARKNAIAARINGEALPAPAQPSGVGGGGQDRFQWMDMAIFLFFAAAFGGGILRRMFGKAGIEVARADQLIGATLAGVEAARALEVEVGAPLLRLTRVVFDVAGRPVERVVALYRADVQRGFDAMSAALKREALSNRGK